MTSTFRTRRAEAPQGRGRWCKSELQPWQALLQVPCILSALPPIPPFPLPGLSYHPPPIFPTLVNHIHDCHKQYCLEPPVIFFKVDLQLHCVAKSSANTVELAIPLWLCCRSKSSASPLAYVPACSLMHQIAVESRPVFLAVMQVGAM